MKNEQLMRLSSQNLNMARNLDLTALRALVTIAEVGGVTRAAGLLNLTQSAVSMQIKRLEESLGIELFSRAQRRLILTPEGEKLVQYSRRMLDLNDEALARLTDSAYEGEIRVGVPHDIVYPQFPRILKEMALDFPRMRINLVACYTVNLKQEFAQGRFDAIMTTEMQPAERGERIASRKLHWVGAPGGQAWMQRPLRLAFVERCIFRPIAQNALSEAGIPWELAVSGQSEQIEAAIAAADLAVSVRMDGAISEQLQPVGGANTLPDLGELSICLYTAATLKGPVADRLTGLIRAAYGTACCETPAMSGRHDDLARGLAAAE